MVHRRARAGSACRRDGLGLNRRRDRTALLRERLAVDRDPLHGLSVLKREPPLRRRAHHLKSEGHLGRCYLTGCVVVLSAVGQNFRRILAWLRYHWP